MSTAWTVTTKIHLNVVDEAALCGAARAAGGDGVDVRSSLQTLVRPQVEHDVPGKTWAQGRDIASVHAGPAS